MILRKITQTLLTLLTMISLANAQTLTQFGSDSFVKIEDGSGGFFANIDGGDRFSRDHDVAGDINGDGILDLVVGARSDDDGETDAGAVYILFMNNDGTVQSNQKISMLEGGFTEPLNANNFFGYGVAGIGDYDGDNIPDIAVAAISPRNNALYIIHLNRDGTVKNYVKNANIVAQGLSAIGDLNGDGKIDLVACDPSSNDGGTQRGAINILFFNNNSEVISANTVTISSTQGGFGVGLEDDDRFGGREVTMLGDLDNDGNKELAVGAFMSDGGKGAIWILSLDATTYNVVSKLKIAEGLNGFSDQLTDSSNPNGTSGANFGHSMCSPGDLNGDGVPDLITGANQQNEGWGYILYLNSDKTVKTYTRINNTDGGFDLNLESEERFSRSISFIGDLRGDGTIAVNMGGGAGTTGILYLLFFKPCDFTQEPGFNRWSSGNVLFSNWNHQLQSLNSESLTIEQCIAKAFETDAANVTYNDNDGRCICMDSTATLVTSTESSTAYKNECFSTPVDPPSETCEAEVQVNGRTITVNNIAAPINTVKILNQNWNIIDDCISWEANDCGNSYSYTVPADGTYHIQVLTFSDWNNQICDFLETVVIADGPTVDCPNLNANIGDTCDDDNTNTINDTVQNDCTCSGTTVPTVGCNALIDVNGQTITVNDIASPISFVKIYDQSWNVLSECSPWSSTDCGNVFTYTVPATGDYQVQILTFTDWSNQVCNILETVTVSSVPIVCNNVTNGGSISGDTNICPNETPSALTNTNFPSGGTGTIEYRWLSATTNCPTALSQTISGANQSTYQPGVLSETTYFRRLSRRLGCNIDADWFEGESNCVVVTVEDNGNCGQVGGCNTTYTINGNTITINNLTENIQTVKVLDSNWNPIFTCDTWTTLCNNSESITVPSSGNYWVQVQTLEDWSTPICNILESVNIGGSARRSSTSILVETAKDNAFTFDDAKDNFENFSLFPNPAQDVINVALKGFEGKNATLKLIDLLGKELKSVRLENISQSTFQMPLDLGSGIYTIWILSDNGKPIGKKFLVSRK